MDNPSQKNNSLKHELTRIFFITVGVFLFILFFQPFPLEALIEENRLLYVTGFGGIILVFTFLILVVAPILMPKWFKFTTWESGPPVVLLVLLLVFTFTANIFYIRFVGNTDLTLYILFKAFLVSLLPVIILNILYKNKSLEHVIEIIQDKNRLYQIKIQELENNGAKELVTIYSEGKSSKLSVRYSDIISVQSADNYVEIYYLDNEIVEKKLIRNTLKNIEEQLSKHPEFIRCHRTSLVNMSHVAKLERNYGSYQLKMKNIDLELPVSRQYLILVKDAISEH